MANQFQTIQKVSYGSSVGATTDAFIDLFQADSSSAANNIKNLTNITIRNTGRTGIELQYTIDSWTNGTPDANIDSPAARYLTQILPVGDYIYLPNLRLLDFSTGGSSGAAYLLNNKDPLAINSTYLYQDSGFTLAAHLDEPDTSITTQSTHEFYFGDLIQVGINTTTATRIEILRVIATSGATLTVERALYGTSKADKDSQTNATSGAVSGAKIYLPFFNIQKNSNQYGGLTTCQTDVSGIFHIMNFFGYGRYASHDAGGVVPGSIAGKFFNAGYQEFGLSGMTPSTNTGLAASTEYGFDITVDGSDNLTSDYMKFTTGTNVNWGGSDGVLSKIQSVLDTQYYTAGNLLNERVTVGIVGGDIRFTSGQRLSTSAILLAAPSAGETTPFGVGRIPAIGSVDAPVAARVPHDIILDRASGIESNNDGAFFYDNGKGGIVGAASGRINYTTGEFYLQGPASAHFVITANYGSAASGGVKISNAGYRNGISNIAARGLNHKIEGLIEVSATEQ